MEIATRGGDMLLKNCKVHAHFTYADRLMADRLSKVAGKLLYLAQCSANPAERIRFRGLASVSFARAAMHLSAAEAREITLHARSNEVPRRN